MLESSRARISRLTPAQAADAWRAGAVVVDIRPAAQRESEGALPGALVIERNVLDWRFDPSSDARLPIADYELQVIVVCQEGYTSSLAAASLQDLGIHRATDVLAGTPPGASCSEGAFRSTNAKRSRPTRPARYVSQHKRQNVPRP